MAALTRVAQGQLTTTVVWYYKLSKIQSPTHYYTAQRNPTADDFEEGGPSAAEPNQRTPRVGLVQASPKGIMPVPYDFTGRNAHSAPTLFTSHNLCTYRAVPSIRAPLPARSILVAQ
jgi:hypothetical protein